MIRNLIFGTLAACAAFFIAQTTVAQEGEHEQRGVQSPCGDDKMLEALTGYFRHRWQSQFFDLGPGPTERYLRHHALMDKDIELVRIFHSSQQPKVAAVTARRFTNHLGNQEEPLVDVFCIVPAPNGSLLRQYDPRELESIIAEPGHDA